MTGSDAAPERAGAADGGARGGPAVDWELLPEPVQVRLAELAAAAVGAMPLGDVPAPLRRLARFTAAKRARLGRTALVAELAGSPSFRAIVAAWSRGDRPGGLPAGTDDPVGAAAAAVLTGDPASPDLVSRAAHRGEAGGLRAERDAALSRADALATELERLRGELAAVRAQVDEAVGHRDEEMRKLRRRVSEQGASLRAATDARAAAERALDEVRRTAAAESAAARAERDRQHDRAEAQQRRAERAAAELTAVRQAGREARKADERRLELLVDTLGAAVSGLRSELALGGGGPRPADLVAGARTAAGGGSADRLAALDALLAVPSSHLVVDGYNVSKTGYPELPLADQRTRLAGQLAALAARTGVEVTVVFDGAGVVSGAPTRGSRGVRVLFSDRGVAADDVIRDLVDAEPAGRPVVVASSDRAVAESVRRRGAHPVPSAVLLERLSPT